MAEMTVIIHGWSDCSESFRNLKDYLVKAGMGTVKTVLYADYESREDSMTFQDVVDGLHDELIKQGVIDENGNRLNDLNIICHSTGGLVIRHWIWRYYTQDGGGPEADIKECPVKRIVMLAPANFGSPLAHRGKSFFASLLRGRWQFGNFLETGKRILEGLELGSPYQWQLAHGDLICKNPYFSGKRIQTTILVGIEGFTGMAQVVNQPGTDGTVVIAGASIDSAKLVLDFSKPSEESIRTEYNPYQWAIDNPKDEFAFGVLQGLDHGSIVGESSDPEKQVCRLLTEALQINTPKQFARLMQKLEDITAETYAKTGKPKYQQFLVHAVDDQDVPVDDFTLDFFVWKDDSSLDGRLVTRDRLSQREQDYSERANQILTAQFHKHSVDPSHRSFLVNLNDIKLLISEARKEFQVPVVLSMRLFVPSIDDGIRYDVESLQNIVLFQSDQKISNIPTFFYENTTTLLEMKVNRCNSYVTVGTEPVKH